MMAHHINLALTTLGTSTAGLTQPLWLKTANIWVSMTSTIILTVIAMISAFFLVRNEIRKFRKRRKKD